MPDEQTQSNQLDPQVVALSQAIRQQEGGNPTAEGASGEYGAYQWEPGTWEKMSQSAGVNVPLKQATLEQQNQVAYNQIAQWKKQGYNPGQIASMWNAGSGKPNAYLTGNSGTNAEGVSYDTSTYAKDVASNYQQIKNSNSDYSQAGNTQPTQSSGQPAWLTALEGLGAGGLAWLGVNAAKPLTDAATDAAIGTVVDPGAGTLAGGLAGLAQGIIGDITGGSNTQSQPSSSSGSSDTSSTPQIPSEPIGPGFQPVQPTPQSSSESKPLEEQIPQAAQASQQVQNGLMQTLKSNGQKGSILATEQEGQMGIGAMARYGGLLGESDENGRYDATGTDENADELLGKMDNAETSVFDAEGATAKTQEGIKAAQEGNKQFVNAPDRPEADKHVSDILNAYAGDYADKDGNISLGDWHRIYKKEGKAFERNASNAKNAAHKSVAMAAQKMIKKNTFHKEFYEKTQKEKQAIINAKKVNKFLHGKKIAKNASFMRDLLKQGGGALGIYLGDRVGGPLGAILGNMVGEKISRAADKKHGRNVFETKGMKAAIKQLESQSPAVAARINQEIAKAKTNKEQESKRRESTLKLPAPKSIPLGPRQGKTESVVVGGKRPPVSYAQAMQRKRGEKEHGGLYQYFQNVENSRKAAGIKK